MTIENDYFENLSERRRSALKYLFKEYQVMNDIQRSVTLPELKGLFRSVINRETDIARQHVPASRHIGRQKLLDSYAWAWVGAFLETVEFYQKNICNYGDAIAVVEEFYQPLPLATSKSSGSVSDILMVLAQEGIDAAQLGSREAHWQLGNMLQVYFGRYSFDRREAALERRNSFDHNAPRPSLQSFQHRQNIRATITGNHGHRDPAISYALYIDRLGEDETSNLTVWKTKTRSFYERQIFLMPGLEEANILLERIKYRYQGDIHYALQSLQGEASLWMREIQKGQPDEAALKEARHDYTLISRANATLCFFNTLSGYSYAGDDLKAMFEFRRVPDVYSVGEVNYDWNSILEKWTREDETKAGLPKKPPKTQSEKQAFKLAELKAKAEKAQKDFLEAQANLSDRKKNEKEHKARERKIIMDKRRAAKETTRREQRKSALASQKKAEQTRSAYRQVATARAEQARQARKNEREERLAQAKRDAEKARGFVKKFQSLKTMNLLRSEKALKMKRNKGLKPIWGMSWRESREFLKNMRVTRNKAAVRNKKGLQQPDQFPRSEI